MRSRNKIIMNEELISIIIPYFKTPKEQVLYCINSILNQSYKQLEIIVVDDGSGEKYSSVLNEIEEIDNRIRIIRQEHNVGLSATRNNGLKFALGNYVMFVDSDDMIHPSTLNNMMRLMKTTNADMVIGELTVIKDYFLAGQKVNDENEYEVMDNVTAIDRLLRNDGFGSTACGRLAYRRIWNRRGEEPFIQGILHEDLASTWEIINNCKTICFMRGEYYYYYQGGESDIHSKVVRDKFCYDFYSGLKKRNDTLNVLYPQLKQSLSYSYLTNIPLIYMYTFETVNPKEKKAFRQTLMSSYKKHFKSGITSPFISKKNVIKYTLFRLAPPLYLWMYKKYRKRKGLRI